MLTCALILLAFAAGLPRPVTYNWREAGEYPFHNGTQMTLEHREAGLRIAQPGTGPALSDGDIRTPKAWLRLIIKNWMNAGSNSVLDGNLYRDGRVNYTDFAVVSRFWKYGEEKTDPNDVVPLAALAEIAKSWLNET